MEDGIIAELGAWQEAKAAVEAKKKHIDACITASEVAYTAYEHAEGVASEAKAKLDQCEADNNDEEATDEAKEEMAVATAKLPRLYKHVARTSVAIQTAMTELSSAMQQVLEVRQRYTECMTIAEQKEAQRILEEAKRAEEEAAKQREEERQRLEEEKKQKEAEEARQQQEKEKALEKKRQEEKELRRQQEREAKKKEDEKQRLHSAQQQLEKSEQNRAAKKKEEDDKLKCALAAADLALATKERLDREKKRPAQPAAAVKSPVKAQKADAPVHKVRFTLPALSSARKVAPAHSDPPVKNTAPLQPPPQEEVPDIEVIPSVPPQEVRTIDSPQKFEYSDTDNANAWASHLQDGTAINMFADHTGYSGDPYHMPQPYVQAPMDPQFQPVPTVEEHTMSLMANHASILKSLSGTGRDIPEFQSPEEKDLLVKVDSIHGYMIPDIASPEQRQEFEGYKAKVLQWKINRCVPTSATGSVNSCYANFQALCRKLCEDIDAQKMDITSVTSHTRDKEEKKAAKQRKKADQEQDPDLLKLPFSDQPSSEEEDEEERGADHSRSKRKKHDTEDGKEASAEAHPTVCVGHVVGIDELPSRVDAMREAFNCEAFHWRCPARSCQVVIKLGVFFPDTVYRHLSSAHKGYTLRCHWCDAFCKPDETSHCNTAEGRPRKECAMKKKYRDFLSNLVKTSATERIRVPKTNDVIDAIQHVAKSFLSSDVVYSSEGNSKTIADAVADICQQISTEKHKNNEFISIPGTMTNHALMKLINRLLKTPTARTSKTSK